MNSVNKLVVALVLIGSAGAASAYDFTVTNSTSTPISGVQATEDGKTWGSFKLEGNIAVGGEMKLVWSPATDESGCEWKVKATFTDGSESEPAAFDFCEENLNIEFKD